MLEMDFDSLVRIDRLVRQHHPTSLSAPNHQLDGVEQKFACYFGLSEFACAFKIVPGNLDRVFHQDRKPLGHHKSPTEQTFLSAISSARCNPAWILTSRME